MKLVVNIALQAEGVFRAWCPSLPGCVVRATSQDEARHKIESAIRSYMMSLNAAPPTELHSRLQVTCVG